MNNIQIRVICCCTLLACSELFHSEVVSVYLLLYRKHVLDPDNTTRITIALAEAWPALQTLHLGNIVSKSCGSSTQKKTPDQRAPFLYLSWLCISHAVILLLIDCHSKVNGELAYRLMGDQYCWSDRVSLYAVCLIHYFSIAFLLIFSRFVFLMLMFHLQRKQIWFCKPIATLTKLRNLFLKVCNIFYKALSVHLFT